MRRSLTALLVAILAGGSLGAAVEGQQVRPKKPPRSYGAVPPPTAPARVEKLDDGRIRIGGVLVDMARKEVSVTGVVNDVTVLEFLVNTKDGYKSYESAIEASATAIDFNLGLILIGLDRNRAVARPRFHFDPVAPAGDGVEVMVSWQEGGRERRLPAEDLIYDDGSKKTLPPGRWVYTGSQFVRNSTAFLADVDGVLIGFVHSPAPLIERAEPVPGPYGAIRLNPSAGLAAGTAVTVTVRPLQGPKD